MIWTTELIQRIILDTAGRVMQQPHAGLPTQVDPALDLSRDLGLNSIQRMELAARLNEFFGVFQTDARNYVLSGTTLAHWVSCIWQARHQRDDVLTFRTSGTSGQAKGVSHTMDSLLSEARFLTQLLPRPRRVISTVASNHIYGFLYTILLPALWQCPLILLSDVSTSDPDDLIIGTPFTWAFLHRSFPPGAQRTCQGVSSTAPLSPELFKQLLDMGVQLTEVYGSSETGGLAYRRHPGDDFTLFPYLTLLPDQATVLRSDTGESLPIPDRLELTSAQTIRMHGRRDDAVSIAGVNVYPAYIRKVIASCPLVVECDVFAKAESGVSQLYGAVQLRQHTAVNRAACLSWIQQHLTAPEIPRHLYLY